MITYLMAAFLIALGVNFLIIRYEDWHSHLSADHDMDGPQKFHEHPVPRIGGVGIATSVAVVWPIMAWLTGAFPVAQAGYLILACTPVFVVGLIEDLTKKISPKARLLAAVVSAILAVYFLGAVIPRVNIPVVDYLFTFTPFALVFTLFAYAGVTNAINIIDGFNGLAAMVSLLAALAIAYVAFQCQDTMLMYSALVLAFAIAGFFVLNYPFGHIFLGDGGAYLLGFLLAVLNVMLIARNPSVSAWFALLTMIYPVFETLFSMYRKCKRNTSIFQPDPYHFHMLTYRRFVDVSFKSWGQKRKNSTTASVLWILSFLSVIPAVLFYQQSMVLFVFTVIFGCSYVWLYRVVATRRVHYPIKPIKKR